MERRKRQRLISTLEMDSLLDLDPGYDAGAFNQSTKLSTRLPHGSQETAIC